MIRKMKASEFKKAPKKRAKKAKRKARSTTSSRVAAIEMREGVVDRRLLVLEKQRQNQAQMIGNLAHRVVGAEGKATSLEGTIAGVYRDHRILEKNAGVFAQKINAATQRIEDLEKRSGGGGELERRVARLEQRLGAIASQRSSDGTTIEGISDRVARLERPNGATPAAGDLPTGFAGAAVEAVEALGGMLDELEQKVEARSRRTDDHDRRLGLLTEHLADRIAKLEAFSETTEGHLRAAVDIRKSGDMRVDELEERIDLVNGRADECFGEARVLEEVARTCDRRLSALESGLDELASVADRVGRLERSDDVIVDDMAAAVVRIGRLERSEWASDAPPTPPFKGEPPGSFEFKNGAKVEGSEKPGPSRGKRPIVFVGEVGGDMRGLDEQTADLVENLSAENVRLASDLGRVSADRDTARAEALGALNSLSEHYRKRSAALGATAINESGERETNDEAARARATAKAEAIEHAAGLLAARWGR